ncbi:MAG: hypothetical protein A2Y73_04660, partial [Chloroflexi bacterium RBG_13_56_8]
KLGINPLVDVPEEIVGSLLREAGKKSAPVQVKATVEGAGPFETNVVKCQGVYRLYLNTKMRNEAQVGIGDTVGIGLEYDPQKRMPPMPEILRQALNQDKQAKDRWRLQPNSLRKEILAYLNSLRSEESMKRNVHRIIRVLL